MRVSLAWLKEWVNPSVDTPTLVAQLTMAGLEVDAVDPVAGAFTQVVVAEILSAEPHPDAAKLRVCSVNVGESAPLQIVCGAANARAGIRVPCARVGAVLPGDRAITEAQLRGVDSFGMLCGADELGLAESSDGLLELPADAPIGVSLRDYLQLDDVVFELGLTPNRGDCLSVAGLAREIAVINRSPLTSVVVADVPAVNADVFPVRLSAGAACPRYAGRVVKGIDLSRPTPLWMRERLRRSGIRSINSVVDITNYVMLELGQPMHAFDLAELAGAIEVRKAREGETLVLLDGQTISLSADTLLIADKSRPLAMAGIMGGEHSGVSDKTRDIFFESAFVEPVHQAGKARRYGLHTDSSHRFERGVDFTLQRRAVERATQLLLEIAGGEPGPVVETTLDDQLPVVAPILLRRPRIERVLGFAIADADVEDILGRLGMDVVTTEEGWHVLPPSFRFDIRIEVDLIEELGRIWGYERLPVSLPKLEFSPSAEPEGQVALDRARALLIDRDYQEVVTYSFVDAAMIEALTPGATARVLANPISADMSHMRTSIWAGLIKTALYNLNRQQTRIRIFESGLVFNEIDGQLQQVPMLGGLIYGTVESEGWAVQARQADFYDLKADVETLLGLTGEGAEFLPVSDPALHPGQAAEIRLRGERIGVLGALHPSLQSRFGFARTVWLFALDQGRALVRRLPKFREISRFPEVRRDLAIIVDENTSSASILNCVRSTAGEWLTQTVLFDVFQGANLGLGRKSVACGLILQHPSRTLKDEEVNSVVNQVVASLQHEFNATLRE